MNVINVASMHINQLRELIRFNTNYSDELRVMVHAMLTELVAAPALAPAHDPARVPARAPAQVHDPANAPFLNMDRFNANVTLRRPTNRTGIVDLTANVTANVTAREIQLEQARRARVTQAHAQAPANLTRMATNANAVAGRTAVGRMATNANANANARQPALPAKCARKPCTKYSELKLNEPSQSDCAICRDVPLLKNMYTTDCHHTYCITCFDQWETHCIQTTAKRASCPLCRADAPKLTSYLPRKSNRVVA